jgi:predicted nucleic acid-binding protein
MSTERISLDSNVLVYAVDRDAGPRHGRAIELVERALYLDCVLTLQSLCEFFHAVTRKGKAPMEEAWAQVQDWQVLFPVASARPSTMARAAAAVQSRRLAFWDAMLWAVAKEAGVTLLLSEDFQDGQALDGVRFANPFATDDLDALLGA